MQIEHPFWVAAEQERKYASSLSRGCNPVAPVVVGPDVEMETTMTTRRRLAALQRCRCSSVRLRSSRRSSSVHLGEAPHALAYAGRPKLPTRPPARRPAGGHPRGGGPKLLRVVTAKLSHALARALRPNLAHTFFLGELGRSRFLFSSKLVGEEGVGGACREARSRKGVLRTREEDEWTGLSLPSGCWKIKFLGP